MAPRESIEVEVAYTERDHQVLVALRLAPGATAGEAVAASGLLERFPQASPQRWGIGVYGEIVPAEHVLSDGDRVEIYRPLEMDPKEARRLRAAQRNAR